MELVEETTIQAVEKQTTQEETPPLQKITRVTKQKRIKDPQKVSAGKLGGAVRTHNLKQKILNDLQGRRFGKKEEPAKIVETTNVATETSTDWTIPAIDDATVL